MLEKLQDHAVDLKEMENVTGGAFDDMKEFYGWIDECYSCLNGSRGKVVGHSVDFLGYQGYVLAFCKQADIKIRTHSDRPAEYMIDEVWRDFNWIREHKDAVLNYLDFKLGVGVT